MSEDPSAEPNRSISTVIFKGKSGDRVCFQALPFDTQLKAVGGVYIVTRRSFEDRTFTTKATHQPLLVGHTANLAEAFISKAQRVKLTAEGANCMCVCAVAEEARRVEIEKDLVEGNEQWGGRLHYLFHPTVPEKAPGVSADS